MIFATRNSSCYRCQYWSESGWEFTIGACASDPAALQHADAAIRSPARILNGGEQE
jgi:hypothetical protein